MKSSGKKRYTREEVEDWFIENDFDSYNNEYDTNLFVMDPQHPLTPKPNWGNPWTSVLLGAIALLFLGIIILVIPKEQVGKLLQGILGDILFMVFVDYCIAGLILELMVDYFVTHWLEDMRILMWMFQIAFGVLVGWGVFVLFMSGHFLSATLYIAGYVIWTAILIYVSVLEWQKKA